MAVKQELKAQEGDILRIWSTLAGLFAHWAKADAWPGVACGLTAAEYERVDATIRSAYTRNGWFTEANVRYALGAWAEQLTAAALQAFVQEVPGYGRPTTVRTVGLVMAGNVPFVGLHDLLVVHLSGHAARIRIASGDAGLTQAVLDTLALLDPSVAERFVVPGDKLGAVDALIATGSDNTARYFEHYFAHVPRVVRRNRTSVAVLDGNETPEELAALGEDVFRYFGLGCRNVGKLFVPQDYDLDRVFGALLPWQDVVQHGKYANNYDFHKALWLLDGVSLLENGFLLVKEDTSPHSPVGSLYVERYSDRPAVEGRLQEQAAMIQCVVGHGAVAFGAAQRPSLTDFADAVDTRVFLAAL